MTIKYDSYKGEIPVVEPHLLPANHAQQAINCQFDSGALSPIPGGLEVATMASNPARSVYTDDGINWFSWVNETIAVNSPILADSFNRLYTLTPSSGILTVVSKSQMAFNGPTPTGGVRAGVPNPTVPPTLTLRDRTTLPDYPSITITAQTWWVDINNSATITNLVTATVTTLVALRTFQITKPPVDGTTPANRKTASRLIFTDNTTGIEIFSLTTYAGGTSRTSALPGGVEATLTEEASRSVWRLTWGVMETRGYTFTVQNSWLEESAPAPPALIAPSYVQDVQIDVTAPSFSGMRPFNSYQFYRTYGSVAAYVGVAPTQGSPSTRFYDGTTKPNTTRAALESEDFYPSPLGMQTLVAGATGYLAGSVGTSVWVSMPYKPHAWPFQYIFPTVVRGIYAAKQAIVVTCADSVYLLVGDNPASMQQVKVELPQPGVSQRSMVGIDGACCYVSRDGLPLVIGSSGSMDMSQKLFTRKKWLERYGDIIDDASIMLGYHDGYVVGVSRTQNKGFVIRMDEDVGSFIQTQDRYESLRMLPVNDALYYTLANKVYRFRGGALIDYDWWGKDFITPDYKSYGAFYIECSAPVRLTLYAEDRQVYDKTIAKGHHRLPPINRQRRWSVRLRGQAVVKQLHIATSMEDLKRV